MEEIADAAEAEGATEVEAGEAMLGKDGIRELIWDARNGGIVKSISINTVELTEKAETL